jgi:hypothetical protein
MKTMTRFAVCVICALFVGAGIAQATTIPASPGNTTVILTTDSRLTTDVTCTVQGAPCIQFGAPGIRLYLNGHTITGRGSRGSCIYASGESGIFTNGYKGVQIIGPGIVRRFNERGIEVTGNYSTVQGVTVISTCQEGILVQGVYNVIQDNSVARMSLIGQFDAGIFLKGGGHNLILNNEISAGGAPGGDGAQGIFVGDSGAAGPSTDNIIKGNSSSGIYGSGLYFTQGSIGNWVTGNQFLGNLSTDDIDDYNNAVGQNQYFQNLCEQSVVGLAPNQVNVCNFPNIPGHQAPENQNQQ